MDSLERRDLTGMAHFRAMTTRGSECMSSSTRRETVSEQLVEGGGVTMVTGRRPEVPPDPGVGRGACSRWRGRGGRGDVGTWGRGDVGTWGRGSGPVTVLTSGGCQRPLPAGNRRPLLYNRLLAPPLIPKIPAGVPLHVLNI